LVWDFSCQGRGSETDAFTEIRKGDLIGGYVRKGGRELKFRLHGVVGWKRST